MHNHGSSVNAGQNPDEQTALLAYMVNHNRSHAEELHELAHSLDGEAAELIHSAVSLFDQGNDKLEQALNIMKGEN